MKEQQPGSVKGKKGRVFKLRNREAFESFINEKAMAVIVVYHYVCPSCESYLEQFKMHSSEEPEDSDISFAKIHIQLEWMIIQAELRGFVEKENMFLTELGVGKKVPATLFYRDGKLKWKLEGVIPEPIFRGLLQKLQVEEENE
jgi:thiol-disulfide isomerase/thioredoxin